MKICQVEGTLVATARIAGLQNRRLLIVKERGSSGKQVAVDPIGCKPSDWVIAVGSSAARDAAGSKDYPSDLTIVGIIDYWDEQTGRAVQSSEKAASEKAAPEGAGAVSGKAGAMADAN